MVEGGDSLNGRAPRPDGEASERRSRWPGCASGVGRTAHALVGVARAGRRVGGRTMSDLATVVGKATAVGSSEPCRSWCASIPWAALPGRSAASSLFQFAWHNPLVNRTCCGRADRATISFSARSALPQQAGYRQRYAARGPGCQWAKAETVCIGRNHGLAVRHPSVWAVGWVPFRASVRRVARSSASRKVLFCPGVAP